MLAQYDEKDGFSFLNGGEIADDVADALNKLQPGMIATSDDFEKLAKKLGTSDQKFINFCTDLKNGNITLKEGQTYLQAYQENVTSLSARLKSFATSAKAFFKNLGGNLLAGTINALGGMLISSVVSLIGVGVSKLYKQISGKAAEEAKQEIQQLGETARSEFDSIQQNLSSTISTVDEVKQHYAELAQGVGDFGKSTQNQGTLTTDDYKDFLDISNQLSDLFPTLTQGYDDNGNAIINLNGDVTTITSSLNSLVEAQKAVASQQIADKMPDIYSDYRQNVSDYADEYNNDLQAMQKAQEAMSYISDPSNYSIDQNGNAFQYLPYFSGIEEVMTKYGLDYDQWMNEWGNGFNTYVSLDDNEKAIFENIYKDFYNQYSKSLTDLEKKIDNENKQFGQYVFQSLYNDSTYQDFSKNDPQKKGIVDSIISNLDYDTVTAKYGKDWGEAYKNLIQKEIINSIAGIDDTKVTDAINKVLNQDLSVSDFNDNIAIIQGYDNEHTEVDFSSWLNPKIESMQAAQDTYNSIMSRFKSNVDSKDIQTPKDIQALKDAKQNLQDEYQKIFDWGLNGYADQIKNDTIQSKFGNVDMDKRTIIHWSDELKQTYADALASWNYDPETGSIDTVFGGSQRFGEELNGNGWEIAFTPILPDGTFLSSDTVYEYIEKIVEQAYANDGQVTDDELKKIDAQGMKIGDTFVHGIYAGVDASQDYDNNGNWAETVGRLMHFSGKDGAIQIAEQNISDLEGKFGQDDSQKIKTFLDSNGISQDANKLSEFNIVTAGITDADEAIQEWTSHAQEGGETVSSLPTTISSAWNQMLNSTDSDTQKAAEVLQTLADKGELTIKTFSETNGAKNYFDSLGMSAEEAVKYINSLSDKNSQLGAMSKNIKSITDALGTKASDGLVSVDDLSGFDATIKGLSTWEKFSTLLGDASSSMEDCQKIANELATEYVNSESVLSNLNETNRAYYESQLNNMGVTNSAAVVEAALAKNLGEEKIATEEAVKAGLSLHGTKIDTTNATELFSNATAGEIIQLANEASQSGVSSQALALLAVKKLNNPTLTTDGDIKNLMDLCKGLDLATQAIKTFQSIKNSVMNPNGTFKATGTAGAQQSEALNNAFNAMKSLVKTSVGGASVNSHGSSGGGTSGGGGGGSSSTAKTAFDKLSDYASKFFDWIEVRLDRLQKKIDSNISKAESKLNDKRYSSATANYMSAVGNTYTKMYTEQKGRDKYLNTANNYLNKAISLGAINKKLAKEIKTRVADGSINISRYSSDIQTVISTYKDWIDKAKDCTTAMQTLHDSLRTYAEDLKKVSDAQRDATVSIAETKQTIATGSVQNTATAKNSSLGYNNSVLNTKNSAYYTAAKSANSNVNRFAKSATSALNKGKIKKNTKYNATLNSIKGYIKKRVTIPDSLLAIVAKKNSTLYNRLYMYNLSIENLQTAREEYTTTFAANNAEKYNNIADKYKNWDDATNDTMDMNSTKSSNAVSAKDKNSYLDKQKSGYGTIVTRDKNEQNEYNKARATAKSNMFKSAKGASYSSLLKTNRNTVNKYINDARKSAKSGKIISVSTLAKLSEYYKKGYISSGFFNSCIDYNNALESYNQAKAQTEIDEQTQITQRAEIASQKFSNISTEYDNKRHQYDQTATELNNNMSILEERGNGASATWYSRLAKNEESSRSNLIQKRTDLVKELNNAVKNGDVAYKSEKWYEMRSQIDDVTNSIDEATKSLAKYNNQIMQIHWDRIDEQANKVQNLIDENNFIIDELSRRDLTSDDTGGLTSEGNAVAGLHISNYEAYKKNAETYYAEIESINKKLANDPYNQKLIDQKEKLVKSYQDCVKGAEDEKWATIDLMKSGYDALKNHISDLIDKFNDLLDSEKDAYDYANSISEKTKTLSDLRKQLVAISGDTSEETRAKAQELNQSLKDAEKDLKDTQYDKLISSTKDMLSDFQTDLDDSIQDVIKNLDDNFSQLINNIDSHWNNETITSLMEKIQYVATDSFNNVSADGKISESTGNVVSDIQSFMEEAWAKYDRDAETTQQDKIDEATKEKVKNNILNNSNSGSSSEASTDVKIDANKLISRIDNPTNKISPAYNNTTTNTNSTAPVGKVLSTSQKKWVNDFLKKNIVVAKQDVSKYGNLNKVLYRNWGKKILPTSKWTELAKKIGFSNFSSATNSAFYQTLHRSGIKGFKKGSDGIPYDMIANLGENGTELQYDISKGVLKSVGQGDMVFTAEQAKTLMEFAKNPMAYKNMYTGTAFSMPSVPVNNKVDNDVNISIGDVKLEGVQDPKQFATAMKDVIKNNTGGVRSMIKEDTIGSLSKGYNSQSVKRW